MPVVPRVDREINTRQGERIALTIHDEKGRSLFLVTQKEADEFGESPYQLIEGASYEYLINNNKYRLQPIPGMVTCFRENPSGGRITPGLFTGTLKIHLINKKDEVVGEFDFEVRSIKTTYREDYRTMLADITEKCTTLLMRYNSPVTHRFNPSFEDDKKTLYQRFAFISSIILSEDFQAALHKIELAPSVTWGHELESTSMRKTRRLGRAEILQIASATKRQPIPETHYLSLRIGSLPLYIASRTKIDSVDTPENRFIRYALDSILHFIIRVKSMMHKGTRARKEASACENLLSEFLSHSMFKEVSAPAHLSLNSPILQNKEGYREIYRAWLMYDLAAKLVWHNNKLSGNDTYDAGKRDIALLYEYWLFFQLIELSGRIFNIATNPVDSLIEPTKDGLGLKLKAGKLIALYGTYRTHGRNLKVKFSYNRTFSGDAKYPEAGSWTVSMRPDYTLSIWPVEFNEDEAEHQEVMLHIHFDAKYKIAEYKEILGADVIDDKIDDHQAAESHKISQNRTDLLKMHAYKDAIRRTAGAYVLYPGTEELVKKGFHEILPGLGAFAVRPSKHNTGIKKLEHFILEVLNRFMHQGSRYEQLTYHKYDIYRQDPVEPLKEATPEQDNGQRETPPAEISILIGYIQEKQKTWVREHGVYNIRIDREVTPHMMGAKYLVLYDHDVVTGTLYKILGYPEIWPAERLVKLGYPGPGKPEYFVYRISTEPIEHFEGMVWDVSKLDRFHDLESCRPFTVNLVELMEVLVDEDDE